MAAAFIYENKNKIKMAKNQIACGIHHSQELALVLIIIVCLWSFQALHLGSMGNPFGPAGTGKTESVKALGGLVGRLVLIFNCDEVWIYLYMLSWFVYFETLIMYTFKPSGLDKEFLLANVHVSMPVELAYALWGDNSVSTWLRYWSWNKIL